MLSTFPYSSYASKESTFHTIQNYNIIDAWAWCAATVNLQIHSSFCTHQVGIRSYDLFIQPSFYVSSSFLQILSELNYSYMKNIIFFTKFLFLTINHSQLVCHSIVFFDKSEIIVVVGAQDSIRVIRIIANLSTPTHAHSSWGVRGGYDGARNLGYTDIYTLWCISHLQQSR